MIQKFMSVIVKQWSKQSATRLSFGKRVRVSKWLEMDYNFLSFGKNVKKLKLLQQALWFLNFTYFIRYFRFNFWLPQFHH